MFSYWEQQSFVRYGHIVAGGGITGLSAAIELKHKFPEERVLIVERGLLPSGASTRNAGFACMGSVTELLADLQTMPEEEVVDLFAERRQGLQILRERLGDKRIRYQENGSYELISEAEVHALDKIEYLNTLLKPVIDKDAFTIADNMIDELGFSKDYTKAIIRNTCEGELHTGEMMRALTDYALQCGVEIKTGAEILRYTEDDDEVVVYVKMGTEELPLHAKTLSVCTNAFTSKILDDIKLHPGRGQVLITKPVQGLKFKGIFHFNEGYYYFREVDGRIMIGGGRNIDFERETTTVDGTTDEVQDSLEEKLKSIIIPDTPFEVDMRWSGIMAFGKTKQPVIEQVSPHVYAAYRMGGMGIAIGSLAGRKLATLIT